MAYDASTGNVVLFGGFGSGYLNDTWTWNGTTWTHQSPPASPPSRDLAAMAYDASTGNVVLFGGLSTTGNLNDTWTWNGTTWTEHLPATRPSARYGASMAYDASTGTLVLFGGYASGDLNDTWTWNGTTWTLQSPSASPTARQNASMAYDASNGTVVLFGGSPGSAALNDTWTWNGTTWTHQSPPASPPSRDLAAMAYDPNLGAVVLFGGSYLSDLNDTWTWNGTTWTQQSPATSPPSTGSVAMSTAYDASTGAVVIFGGINGTNGTWNYQLSSPVNFGTANVCPSGTTPSPCSLSATLSFQFTTAGSGISASVVTQGATGLDFADAGTGTCDTNGTSHAYTVGATCTVNVTFTPKAPGLRMGAARLKNNSGATIATAYVSGTGQGPAVGFLQPATQTTVGTGLAVPWGVATDAAGNFYASRNNSGTIQIFKIAPNGVQTPVGATATSVLGLAVDGAGDVLYADWDIDGVVIVPPGCVTSSCQTTVPANGLNGTDGVAVDGQGDVFITEYYNNQVVEVTPGGVQTTVPAVGLNGPQALAVDSAGDLYIADSGNNRVVEVTPGGVQTTVPANGLNGPASVAVDAAGDVYIDDAGNLRLVEVTPGGTQTTLEVTGGLSVPVGVATDSMGQVYIVDEGNNRIVKFQLAVSPALSFASTTVGRQSSDSPQTVILENIGNAALTFPVPATGENPSVSANFTLDSSTTCPEVTTSSPAGSLAPGVTCDLAVDFLPTSGGTITGSVNLTDNNLNATNGLQAIQLSGTGLKVSPTVSVTSSPNPSTFGQSVTFTATISGGYSPSGTVTITSGVTTLCSASVTSTTAQCASSALAVGTDPIVATYAGDTSNNANAGSISGGQQVQVATVNVVIGTSMPGLSFSIGGTTYTSTQAPTLTIGTPYTLSTTTPQLGAPGVEYVFSGWSDGTPTLTDTLTPTSSTISVTAIFSPFYQASVTVETGGVVDSTGGTATVPAGYYDLGTPLNISATPNPGYYFAGWSGGNIAAPGSPNTTVTVNGVENLVADFELIPTIQGTNLTDDPPGNAANCPGPACTLRDAILAAEANNGGAGNITLPAGTITLTAPLPALTGQITISGPGANLLTISGNNSSAVGSIFQVSSGATVIISGLTIANGSDNGTGGGGILNNGGTVTVSNCELVNNTANGSNGGGGILNNGGTLTVSGNTFLGNQANSGNGGAINNNGGTLAVSYSTFDNNTASGNGGAIVVSGSSTSTIANGTFYSNTATGNGGAIDGDSTLLTVANSIFDLNSAAVGSGMFADTGAISSSNNLFYLNVDNGGPEDDCRNCSPNTNPTSGNPNLSAPALDGASTPTQSPLPPSAALCAGPAVAPGTDQRGFPNSTTYNGTACYDLGAVQTNYALSFTTEPPSTGTVAGTAMSPAPAVTVTESGGAFPGSVSVSATDANADLATNPSTATTTADVANFSSLIFTGVTNGDTLTATLALNPNNAAFNLTTQSTSFSVGVATPTVTWPTASAINYGQLLSASLLTGGSASSNGTPVSGSFAFTNATTVPGAGTQSEGVTFTPTNSNTYSPVTSTVSVLVNQAKPTVTSPTASAINYGQMLSASTLTGGTAVSPITSATVQGGFAFTTPTTVPAAGTQSESVTFTPTDAIDYASVTTTVSVLVNKVNSPVTTWPSAGAITYGQQLSASTLSGGVATVGGSFAFTNPATLAGAGTQSESVTFTPSNLADYSPVSNTVSVLVNKATPTVTWPTASAINYGQMLSASTLTGGSAVSPITSATVGGGFAFASPTTVPGAGTQTESVIFTPTDAVDYASVTSTVSVLVNKVNSPVTTWPSASAITYGQSLSAATLSGGVASVGGSFAFTNPATIPAAGTQPESVTFTPSNLIDYSSVSSNVSVLVNKATPTVTWPTASAINSGQTLASSTLTGGSATSPISSAAVSGSFTFTTPTTAPTATGPQSVTFKPADTTDYNTVTGSVTVTVTVASAPVASISPTAINFGTLYLGSIVTKTVTVTNTGNAAMTISDPLLAIVQGGNSEEFITVNLCPKSLAAGKSCTMTVTFVAGPFYTPQTATLKITDNAAGSPQTVMLTATVIDPVPAFSAGSLSFGTVKTSSGTAAKSVTLTSAGGTSLSITGFAITGADPKDFTETNTCPATMAPKATCSITVTFKPTVKGSRTATLVVTDSAQNSPQSIALSGTGD
jgi:parallel beta-helix repeat protein